MVGKDDPCMLQEAQGLLKKYFGYDSFRSGQAEIISRLLNQQDTVGIMPTGGGKSVCYQIPALMLPGITLVISPLISLMKDQVDALEKQGISATFINSSLTSDEAWKRLRGVSDGRYKLLYVAPERLEVPSFLNRLLQLNISLVAIDEAHCISQWGHDFRPSYRLIINMIESCAVRPTVVALTATATPRVTADICDLLKIGRKEVILTGFARDNLYFQVIKGQSRRVFINEYVRKNKDQPGIIYAATRKEVDNLHHFLKKEGIQVGKYHAGMSEEDRQKNQEQFLYDDVTVLVATNAFGMGINKSNVRYVMHYNMPRNIEAYYQEAGRAGRDGERGDCILLFAPEDIQLQKFFIDQSEMDDVLKKDEYHKLERMISYCHTEDCLQSYILEYFGDQSSERCERCGNCKDDRKRQDVTREAQMVLSCIKRIRERFGKTFVAQILTGATNQRIKDFGFDRLSTYAIMRDRTQKDVSSFIDFLTADQYLIPSGGTYPTLSLSRKAISVLKGESKVFKKENIKAVKVTVDDALFEKLRDIRKQLAAKEMVPPYVVFSDQSLRDMCAKLPSSDMEFLMIKGVGQQKLERYGEVFLRAIAEYQGNKEVSL